MNQQIIGYIQQQLRAGYDMNSVISFLMQQGYNQKDVNEAADFLNKQRLSSLVDYVKTSLGSGAEPDTVRSQLQASGYPMPDINEAIKQAQRKPAKMPVHIVLILLVALVIFGLGLFFFLPSGGEEATGPGIIKDNAEAATPGISFQTEPAVAFDRGKEPAFEKKKPEEIVISEGFEDNFSAYDESLNETPEVADFSAETSGFEELIDKASKETNVDNALKICKEAESTIYMDACYDQLSKSFDSSAICAKIEDESIRDQCYLRIILKNKDYALCENIIDSSLYNSCISMETTAPANVTLDDFADWSI